MGTKTGIKGHGRGHGRQGLDSGLGLGLDWRRGRNRVWLCLRLCLLQRLCLKELGHRSGRWSNLGIDIERRAKRGQ